MTWSFPIAKIFGSEVRIHVTFFLLLAWIGIARYMDGGVSAAVEGLVLIVAIFACVVAHEFGHAIAARQYGIRTPDITLLPIGGLARLERMPENPVHEIVVALAGPAVNVVIAVVLVVFLGASVDPAALEALDDPGTNLLVQLAAVNVFLVLFNLIPAFPMDGGRVLRALLSFRYNRVDATNVAARIGQALAFAFGFLGLMGNPILIFIAIFVYIAATAEAEATSLMDVSRSVGVRQAMITRFERLGPGSTVADAADCLLRTTQREFPVTDGAGHLRGVLTRDAMIAALTRSGPETPVLDVMERDVPTVQLGERLSGALETLQKGEKSAVGVVDSAGRLVGYITAENIGELMMIRRADPDRTVARRPLLPQ